MGGLRDVISFLVFTVSDGKAIYSAAAGGGITSQAVINQSDFASNLIITYTPTVAVLVAVIKLVFDLCRWVNNKG